MQSQACEPCAKRKVRCDKGDPCSNCKRRKKDHCIYPETSPSDRIKRLESLVRSLGGDPESEAQDTSLPNDTYPSSAKARTPLQHKDRRALKLIDDMKRNPIIVEEDGHSVYLESCVRPFQQGNTADYEGAHSMAGLVMRITAARIAE